MKILIVDDSKSIKMVLESTLQEQGHECRHVNNGKNLIQFLNKKDWLPELIYLDWNMPEMNGLDFLKENFKNNYTTCPIILMTTMSNIKEINEAFKLGVKDYLKKPFTKETLFKQLSKYIT